MIVYAVKKDILMKLRKNTISVDLLLI